MKVYCERGAITSGLRRLQRDGRIEIVRYEPDPPRHVFNGSDKYPEIERIIGRANHKDIRHVDAAYQSGCSCFFTIDKRDILAKRSALEDLLGIAFLHPQEDWRSFLVALREYEAQRGSE